MGMLIENVMRMSIKPTYLKVHSCKICFTYTLLKDRKYLKSILFTNINHKL